MSWRTSAVLSFLFAALAFGVALANQGMHFDLAERVYNALGLGVFGCWGYSLAARRAELSRGGGS